MVAIAEVAVAAVAATAKVAIAVAMAAKAVAVAVNKVFEVNTFGNIFRLTTFGESHGPAVGGIIDGMPAGIPVDMQFLQAEMARRRPGQSAITTSRSEADQVEVLSGVFEGKTTGTPIGFEVRNSNQHSSDYDALRDVYRPSHADVVGGAFAKMALRALGIDVKAYTSQVGNICLDNDWTKYDLSLIEKNAVRCPDAHSAALMEQLIREVKADGDTIGGVITCVIQGVPAGLGEPVFGRLNAALGAAMLSINACKGFEYGMGFDQCGCRGSEMIDTFLPASPSATSHRTLLKTEANHSGGIQGGISNGAPIYFRCAFKPVATLLKPIPTVNRQGEATILQARGRHDPCVLPRAVPIVEAMAAMTILDYYLLNKTIHI